MFNFLVYRKFRTHIWNKLKPSSRLRLFQKMEKIVSKKVGRPQFEIIPRKWDDLTNGLCVYKDKAIYINCSFFNDNSKQFLGLATLFHEQRHAEQFFIVSTTKKFNRFSKSYKWKKNMEAYILYEGKEKFSYYSMQEVERDANKYAINKLKKMKFWFRRDDNYYYALNRKIKEYEVTKEIAKKELGFFYKLKLKMRQNKERKKNR